jgi:outer membrane protein TolC
MKQKILLLFTLTAFSFAGFSQDDLQEYLSSVKAQNKTIKAAEKVFAVRSLEAKTGITLSNPEFELGYFPGNKAAIGTKQVIGLSQSFSIATLSGQRKRVAESSIEQAGLEYGFAVQNVLGEARQIWNQAVYLNQLGQQYQLRANEASTMLEFYQKKLDNGNATQLDVNKAKLFLLHWQNKMRQLQGKKTIIHLQLKQLNGGIEYTVDANSFLLREPVPWENLEMQLKEKHFALKIADQSFFKAGEEIKLSRQEGMPEITLGFETEKVLSDSYAGVKAGVSIPLWANKNNVKRARAEQEAASVEQERLMLELLTEYQKLHATTLALHKSIATLKQELAIMDNTGLLKKSLELGQISAITYFQEITFFYDIFDELLEMELEFEQAKEELTRFQLKVK